MRFELLPLVSKMIEYYQLPRGFERFQEYIKLLTGESKDDMEFPIVAFNPMGREHVLDMLKELQKLEAEKIISECIKNFNASLSHNESGRTFKVSLSLADDLKGGWTNRYTTDYQAKFRNQAFIKRNFCTVMFWTSDTISPDLIQERTEEFLNRTLYQLAFEQPETLEEHIKQEAFISHKMNLEKAFDLEDAEFYSLTYELNKPQTDYPLIFNFLYGDKAAIELGYKPIGIKEDFMGFKYAGVLENI